MLKQVEEIASSLRSAIAPRSSLAMTSLDGAYTGKDSLSALLF